MQCLKTGTKETVEDIIQDSLMIREINSMEIWSF